MPKLAMVFSSFLVALLLSSMLVLLFLILLGHLAHLHLDVFSLEAPFELSAIAYKRPLSSIFNSMVWLHEERGNFLDSYPYPHESR